MTKDKKQKFLEDSLLEDLELLKEWAHRSIVCPPLYGLKQKVDKAYDNIKKYIKEAVYKNKIK